MKPTIGPVILDLIGTELNQEEREMLQHPLVGGVILFTRNYDSPKQLQQLCQSIRASRKTPLLITADQEGGRVQRFREGFTRLPAMSQIGACYDASADKGLHLAESCGWLMAAELLAVGLDLSFAPVLDLDKKLNAVVSDRAFHQEKNKVVTLASAFIRGMNQAGMAATGKHFPGHGTVTFDSHYVMPVDQRNLQEVLNDDAQPFIEFIQQRISALMPAHILFPAVDQMPVGFSAKWLKTILRQQLQFSGVIISDDLNMEGANMAGNHVDRALAALTAGCDFILICNNRQAAIAMLDQLPKTFHVDSEKFTMLQGRRDLTLVALHASSKWRMCQQLILESRKNYEHIES